MYNPFPYLPKRMQGMITFLRTRKMPAKLVFYSMATLATIWFLMRVIPKPSRASYPCMQATAPFASAFVMYLLGSGGFVMAFKRFGQALSKSKYALAGVFLLAALGLFMFTNSQHAIKATAKSQQVTSDFTPNEPIGIAKGILPGRVTWMWDPRSTNENCTNTSNNNGIIDSDDDAWFQAANNNFQVIDSMVIRSVIALAGASTNAGAWDQIFRHFNLKHGNGNVGYSEGEKIFLKINATSAYGGLATGKYYADLGRNDNLAINDFAAETNPYVVLSIIGQLVHVAQVPEDMIYVGDPARNIYKEFYTLWHDAYPNVHYLGNNLLHPELDINGLGRTAVAVTANDRVFFSDHGSVMPDAISDKLFTIFDEMDYLINIPTMKAHATGGITLAAKNHFGSFTRQWAMHLHKGLMDGADDPTRLGYGLYRVQTDIMMHNLLSGKNLLIVVDGLYPSDDALAVPDKWMSQPFDNDWCSSIIMSLDPVAVESVCHDFLRTEYNGPTIAESRPNWSGVDDYLHQAGDSSLWADGIVYDPDNDGVLIASLGVHEHWNDSINKQYTRNLGTGNGIELLKVHEIGTYVTPQLHPLLVRLYPNPARDFVTLTNEESAAVSYTCVDIQGRKFMSGMLPPNATCHIALGSMPNGTYLFRLNGKTGTSSIKLIKQQ